MTATVDDEAIRILEDGTIPPAFEFLDVPSPDYIAKHKWYAIAILARKPNVPIHQNDAEQVRSASPAGFVFPEPPVDSDKTDWVFRTGIYFSDARDLQAIRVKIPNIAVSGGVAKLAESCRRVFVDYHKPLPEKEMTFDVVEHFRHSEFFELRKLCGQSKSSTAILVPPGSLTVEDVDYLAGGVFIRDSRKLAAVLSRITDRGKRPVTVVFDLGGSATAESVKNEDCVFESFSSNDETIRLILQTSKQ